MIPIWGTSTGAKATLDLDFLGATSLDNRITFSRGSQATLFDSTGTLVYATHNLLLQSQAFDLANWVKNNGATVTANAGVAPDGTTTADQFNGAASTSTGVFAFPAGVQSNVAYTFSVYVKNVSAATTLTIGCDANPSNAKVTFNAATGAITAAGANVTSSSVFDMGSGWYRVVVRFITTSTAPGVVIYADTGALATWLVWGAQLNITNMEGGVTSSLSTYYPTTTAAYYAPRFDFNPSTLAAQGLLIEEQRTNSIRNNTMQGAVAGTPGTLPTNWYTFTALTGLTRTIVGTGTDAGITYIDVRINGTPSAAGSYQFGDDATNIAAAASGQTWTHSLYYKIVGGSLSGITQLVISVSEYTAANAYLTGSFPGQATPTSTWQRGVATRTLNQATTAFVGPGFQLDLTGAAIDITLRIGLPQLEQGAFATSVIPTTTTALTRNADVASMTGTNFSSWYNQSAGTFLTVYSLARPSSGSNQFTVRASDNGYNNSVAMNNNATGFAAIATASGGVFDGVATAVTPLTANVAVRFIGCYATNDLAVSLNGAAVVTDTSATIPTGMTRLDIGSDHAGVNRIQGGYIQRISYYPVRLPNSTLQALTA